jgi:hypothetical protein
MHLGLPAPGLVTRQCLKLSAPESQSGDLKVPAVSQVVHFAVVDMVLYSGSRLVCLSSPRKKKLSGSVTEVEAHSHLTRKYLVQGFKCLLSPGP